MLIGDIFIQPLVLIILPLVAFLYASIGHDGASGYIAVMSIFSIPISFVKPTALVLNIFVSGLSFYFYYRAKHFSWKLFYPFAMASIPFSFIGGYLTIDPTVYNIILGIFLFIAALRLLGVFGKFNAVITEINLYYALSIGAIIGFLSGLIGIGGGIVLSPVLYLLRWANIKQTAAISALFILVNSISGILGFIFKGGTLPTSSALLIGIVLTGGLLGAYYGSKKLGTVTLQRFLALVLIIAMIKLFII